MASYEEVSVSGYEEFMQVVEQHSGKTIFAYFSGSKDAEGKSWCPDCVQGEARIREAAAQRKCLEGRGYSQIAGWRGSGGSLVPGVPQGDLSFPLAFSYPVPTLLNMLRPSRPTKTEPVVREGLKHVGEGCVFIYCQVGEKPYWKDPNNDFRKNLKLTAVPTLLKYGT
ncbi:TXNDC17, partial [Cervus elaphus hippelaphus]